MRKSLALIGAGLVGVGTVTVPTIAQATTADCGATPTGATLSESNGVCQAEFASAGSFTFTIPSGASELAAILVGGGGGAFADGSNGYAGYGADVRYVDAVAAPSAGNTLDLIVGQGGGSAASPTDGEDSSLTNGVLLYTATGGIQGVMSGEQYCTLDGSNSTYIALGDGAGGPAVNVGGGACVSPGPGLNPTVDVQDSYSNAVPAIFANYDAELGIGGYVTATPLTAEAVGPVPLVGAPGQGGSAEMNLVTTVLTSEIDGSDGLVVLRWKSGLPSTGVDSTQTAMTAVASLTAMIAGVAFVVAALRKKRRTQ